MDTSLTRRQFGWLAAAAAQRARAAARPNVIVVLADDQGYADIGAHGHPEIKTPTLDRLHGEAVRLTDFHVSPMCTPTRSQLMTGCDALFNRAMNVSSGRTLLRRDLPTMADVFAAGGYRTGIFGKWHLGDTYPYRPQDRGFGESVWYASSHIGAVPDAWDNDYFSDRYRHNGHLQQYQGYSGDVFFDEAMRWMRTGSAAQPFFAYIPLNAAHGPLFVPPEYREPYRHLPERYQRYYGMIANIDRNMGRLEAMLRETGLRENTILLYFSDNGPTQNTVTFNAGMRGVKTTLYEGGHRAPCFVRWPSGGIGGGRDVAGLTEVQDLLPTFIELCGLPRPARAQFDGTSVAGALRGKGVPAEDRTLVVQFSRMDRQRPQKNDAAVLWKRWRLTGGTELHDLESDPEQSKNVAAQHAEVVARMQSHYDRWWQRVEPQLDRFLPVTVGSERENPVMLSACEWADVFLDQGAQVRRGERRNGVWHIEVAEAGDYDFALRRWPRECDAAIAAGIPAHQGEDGVSAEGVALPIARARLKVGAFDRTTDVSAEQREVAFRVKLPAGETTLQSWFLDAGGAEITGAYYVYAERISRAAHVQPQRIILDTDIMGDVDDVGAVALLHTLMKRGEAEVLAMMTSGLHPWSPSCLDALNTWFGRPEIPIGTNQGAGFLRDSKYAEQIAAGWPHKLKSLKDAPETVDLYRRILAREPDGAVVLISVGQLTNLSNLLKSRPDRHSPLSGVDLVRRKVRVWVCMGAKFPSGREANIYHDPLPAQHAIREWPGRIVFSGWEIGQEIMTGSKVASLPAQNPVRKGYELYNGLQPRQSWDQTAVLYGVRCIEQDRGLWTLSPTGVCDVEADGSNTWRDDPAGRHQYLIARRSNSALADMIEALMLG